MTVGQPVHPMPAGGSLDWYGALAPVEKRTFWACFGGWALDAMDVQIYGFVIPTLIASWGIDQRGMPAPRHRRRLLFSAFGGWFAGMLADRFGRVRTLQITIVWFAFFTFVQGFAQSYGSCWWRAPSWGSASAANGRRARS